MAKCGFYEIRTFETLSRDYGANRAIYEPLTPAPKDPAAVEEEAGNKRTMKQKDKGMLVTAPKTDIRGHTGYLTFAIKF